MTASKTRAAEASVAARSGIRPWLAVPAPFWVALTLAGMIVVTPAWMLADDLGNFALRDDDFAYIAGSRDWQTTRAHLLEPHNTHVVPIFRLWTFALVQLAGRLEYLPTVLAASSYLALVAAMLAISRVVARETGKHVMGLSAMAVLGISTVTHPAVIWFSAGQALWAGTAILVTIAFAQSWVEKRGAIRLAAVALGALLSPAIWSGGLVAGPAAIAYICARKSCRVRGPALLLGCITLGAVLLIVASSPPQIRGTELVWRGHAGLWPRPIQALLHSLQALVEVCVVANLGLDATTTPRQAFALLIVLAILHAWSRGRPWRFNPLEASGATIAVGSCLLVYTFRGNVPYSSLRTLGWYHTIPQVGAILFGAGWLTALSTPEPSRLRIGQAARVIGLVIVFCLIQVPRSQQQLIQGAPPFSPNEALSFPSVELRLARARYLKVEFHERQVRALARLDRVNRLLSNLDASPETLRDVFGRAAVPGIAENQLAIDCFSLLTPRPRNANAGPALAIHSAELIDLLRPEPAPVPPWLDPNDAVSRAVREISSDHHQELPLH